MNVLVDRLEHSTVKLTIEVDADKFIDAVKRIYNKKKGQFKILGFRLGKAPMAVIEKTYGPVFDADAAEELIKSEYPIAVVESKLKVMSQPIIDIIQIEKGKNFIFTAEVAVEPEVTLGQYKGIEIKKVEVKVTEEEVFSEILKEQENNAREIIVEDREVVEGDIVYIDYVGMVDGVAFDGGTAENMRLVIGSHCFIEGVEEQIIGHSIGDKFNINVTFPKEFDVPELADKNVVFSITINKIKVKVLSAIDDSFAREVSGFDTLDEMKADIKERLLFKKKEAAVTEKENAIVDIIIENAKIDISQIMIRTKAEDMLEDMELRLASQGLTFEQYMEYSGMTRDEIMEEMLPKAKKEIEVGLVLEAIAKAEKIEVTEEDINAEITKMAEKSQKEPEEVKSFFAEKIEDLKTDIATQKALAFVVDEAKEI